MLPVLKKPTTGTRAHAVRHDHIEQKGFELNEVLSEKKSAPYDTMIFAAFVMRVQVSEINRLKKEILSSNVKLI